MRLSYCSVRQDAGFEREKIQSKKIYFLQRELVEIGVYVD
jgi:hypothetical protein